MNLFCLHHVHTFRSFADTELAPNAHEWDQKHMYPANAVKMMSEMGLMGVAQNADYVRSSHHIPSFACLPIRL